MWEYSIALPKYNKEAALVQDKQTELKLQRVGEAVLRNGSWSMNDEKVSSLSFRSYVRITSGSSGNRSSGSSSRVDSSSGSSSDSSGGSSSGGGS